MDSRFEKERVEKILENAVWSTYSKYSSLDGKKDHETGIRQAAGALKEYLESGETKYFSNNNGGRDGIKSVTRANIAGYLSRFIYDCARSRAGQNDKQKDLYWKIVCLEEFKISNKDNIIRELNECLSATKYSFAQFGKSRGIKSTELELLVTDIYTRDLVERIQEKQNKMAEAVSRKINPKFGVKNLEINNECRNNILLGINYKYAFYDVYGNGELMGAIAEGEDRHNQEDSVLLLYHPKNPKYKFMAVADGMGGLNNGRLASNEALREMLKWFESLPTGYFADVNNNALRTEWANKLQEISDTISMKYGNAGTTFTGVIVGDNRITIASVGDSRGYVVGNDNNLYQLTEDDTKPYEVWKAKWDKFEKSRNGNMRRTDIYEKKRQKELLATDEQSRLLTGFLGNNNPCVNVHFSGIDKSRCKLVMLCTNGIPKCLTDDMILATIRETDDPRVLGGKIINRAMVRKENNIRYGGKKIRDDDKALAYWVNNGQKKGPGRHYYEGDER